MKKQCHVQLVVWLAATLLLAGGTAYIGRGLWIPWERDHDIDLKLRNVEHAIFMQRIYPHALVAAHEGHPVATTTHIAKRQDPVDDSVQQMTGAVGRGSVAYQHPAMSGMTG